MGKNKGCLLFFLSLLNPNKEKLPYKAKPLLSPAELSFHRALQQAIGGEYQILCKVKLDDIICVEKATKDWQVYKNKINRKHIDFILCSQDKMTVECAIELDDKSHEREDRKERDDFVDKALSIAGLKIIHIKCQKNYSVSELKKSIEEHLSPSTTS